MAICGAGIAGLAAAERMSALGAEVVLLERSPGPRTQGYLIDFFGAGYDAAEAIGVLPAIEDLAYQVEEASLVDTHGRRRAGIPYGLIAKALEGRLCSIMRPDLEKALRDNLPGDVDLRFGASVADVFHRDEGVTVTLADGGELDVDLLIGADGIHSTVRTLVFGDESQYLRYLGFHTAAFVVDAPEIREVAGDRVMLTDTLDRQLGFSVLRDGKVAAFAVHRAPDPQRPSDVRVAIQSNYADMGWLVPQALENCPPAEEIYYDQVAQVVMPTWRKNRVVLLGDSCAAVSLLAGQGASLAVAAAYLLAEQFRRTSSVDRALDFYERLWRPTVEDKQKTARDMANRFLPATSGQQRTRRLALRFAWFGPVKRRLVAALVGEPDAVIPMLLDTASEDQAAEKPF
ncbi:FAD-dependent monooxygenase [Mycobacterium intermedium]|nr:FAD-dependent monooxygenase [Mycobacterium intermedium]